MAFARNQWYAGLWSEELDKNPVGRQILGEKVVFYRTESGKAVVLENACPHRFAPLEYGIVLGEHIKCRYHGLEFNSGGCCSKDPSGKKPPKAMKVKSYPVEEKHGMLFVWIGDEQPTKPAPDWLDHGWGYGGALHGYLKAGANYKLMVDNILDNAHSTHLHEFLETSGLIADPVAKVVDHGDLIVSDIHLTDTPPNQLFAPLIGRPGNVDQFHRATWLTPSAVRLQVGVVEPGGNYEDQIGVFTTHMITPETETSSHYFWGFTRNALLDNHAYTEKLKQGLQHIFTTEDVWMLEGQQRMLEGDDFWERKPVLLPQDKATALVRRRIEKLESAEDTSEDELYLVNEGFAR
jgi:vanillate O-demethylase monooxygenase subunit